MAQSMRIHNDYTFPDKSKVIVTLVATWDDVVNSSDLESVLQRHSEVFTDEAEERGIIAHNSWVNN